MKIMVIAKPVYIFCNISLKQHYMLYLIEYWENEEIIYEKNWVNWEESCQTPYHFAPRSIFLFQYPIFEKYVFPLRYLRKKGMIQESHFAPLFISKTS